MNRAAGDSAPPSVLFHYSADRKGEGPQDHLRVLRGFLQADGYAVYSRLYGSKIVEVKNREQVTEGFAPQFNILEWITDGAQIKPASYVSKLSLVLSCSRG